MILPESQSTQPWVFFNEEGLRPGWGLVLFAVLYFTFSLILQPRSPHSALQTPRTRIPEEAVAVVAVFLATAILGRIERRPVLSYGLTARALLSNLVRGTLTGLVSLTALLAILVLTGLLHADGGLLTVRAALRYGAVWALGFGLIAVFEETLLRGYAQVTLTRALTPVVELFWKNPGPIAFAAAALILSFLFGLGHATNPGESPLGVLSAGLFGLVLCLSLYRTGSLWWAIGFHAAWDWAQSFLYGVPDSGALFEGRLLATHPSGPPILSGGLTGPEGSIYIFPTLILVAAIILLSPRSPDSGSRSGPARAPAPEACHH